MHFERIQHLFIQKIQYNLNISHNLVSLQSNEKFYYGNITLVNSRRKHEKERKEKRISWEERENEKEGTKSDTGKLQWKRKK